MSNFHLMLLLALACFFSSVDAGSNARRHARDRRESARLRTQEWCIAEVDKYGEDNVPYWITLCKESSSACRSPEVTGVTHATVSIKTGKCDHSMWELSNCSNLCKIDLTTPGSIPSSCVPEHTNPLLDAVVKVMLVLVILYFIRPL